MTVTAAPGWSRILAHADYEMRAALRNGEQVLLTLILPALILVFLTRTDLVQLDEPRIDTVAPGVIALAIMSSAFTSVAIATGFDRRAGALRMLATTPLGRLGLLGGKVGGVLGIQAVQLIVLGLIAVGLGWRPPLAGLPLALLAGVLGTAAFVALALLLAGTLRAEAVLAGANLLWVLLLVGGGILLAGPTWTLALPSGALGHALRVAAAGGFEALPLLILAAWTVVLATAAARLFRWH